LRIEGDLTAAHETSSLPVPKPPPSALASSRERAADMSVD
jgi:hypothetical protein